MEKHAAEVLSREEEKRQELEERRKYFIANRKVWLLDIKEIVEKELKSNELLESTEAYFLYGGWYELDEWRQKQQRMADCPEHDFQYAYATSHECIYKCTKCDKEQE